MSSMLLRPSSGGRCPTFLTIGHVTRDLLSDATFTLGGTVTFAALTAYHLGLDAALVTCADESLLAQLSSLLPEIALAARSAPVTTTFENSYDAAGFRTQYLHYLSRWRPCWSRRGITVAGRAGRFLGLF